VSESNPPTYQYLLSNYGPLLTLKHLAEVLHSTPNGVRMTIARRRQPFAVALSAARRRLGRRVYFDASRVAEAIDQANAGESAELSLLPRDADNAGDMLGSDWPGALR